MILGLLFSAAVLLAVGFIGATIAVTKGTSLDREARAWADFTRGL
jgi:hypothetical protein